MVARQNLDVAVGVGKWTVGADLQRVQEARVDKRIAGVELQRVRLEIDFGLDALAAGRTDVLEIAEPLQHRTGNGENVVGVVGAEARRASIRACRYSDLWLPRKPASTVCDTTCFSGGSETRNAAMMQGWAGSAQPSSSGVGARLASE